MSVKSYCTIVSILIAICALGFVVSVEGRGQDQSKETGDTDRIYKDPDKKAVIDKRSRESNSPSPSGCKGRGTVIIRAVLRKSGKVTDVKVVEPGGCAEFERRAIKSVANTKFKPAMKNAVPVSTYTTFEYHFSCHGDCP